MIDDALRRYWHPVSVELGARDRSHRHRASRATARRVAEPVGRRRGAVGAVPAPRDGAVARCDRRRMSRVSVPRVEVRRRRALRRDATARGRRDDSGARCGRELRVHGAVRIGVGRTRSARVRHPGVPRVGRPRLPTRGVPRVHVGHERAPHGRELHRLRPPRLVARRLPRLERRHRRARSSRGRQRR